MEFVARVLVQIPDPRRHLVHYYGASSNAARGKRKKAATPAELRSRPLVCPRCAGEIRVVGIITQPAVIMRILDHLRKREKVARPPPRAPQPLASLA